MPTALEAKIRQSVGLYNNGWLYFNTIVKQYDEWLRLRPFDAAGIELCRLCGRNSVPLVHPWTFQSFVGTSLLQQSVSVSEVRRRVRQLLTNDVSGACKWVGHHAKFDCKIVPRQSSRFFVSPRVCVEDLCWFFWHHCVPRVHRGSAASRVEIHRAISWPSLLGFWLSSRHARTVEEVWSLLPPDVRQCWMIVEEWVAEKQEAGDIVRSEPEVGSRVPPVTRRMMRCIEALRRKCRQHASTRCVSCRLSLFPEEVDGVQLLATSEYMWLNKGGPGELRKRLLGDVPREAKAGMALCEGWRSSWRTFYGFIIMARVWICERRGLVVSACVFCVENPELHHFVTPRPPRELFLPARMSLYGEEDDDDVWLQPANGVDLGFLGVVRLVDLTMKASRVCYRQGDPSRPGNLLFRVLRVRGDSRGASTAFFSLTPARHIAVRFAILGPTRHDWIRCTVYERPDLAVWWKELKARGVMDEGYDIGPDVRVEHPEGVWLAEAAERRRRREELLGGRRAVREAVAATLRGDGSSGAAAAHGIAPSAGAAPSTHSTEAARQRTYVQMQASSDEAHASPASTAASQEWTSSEATRDRPMGSPPCTTRPQRAHDAPPGIANTGNAAHINCFIQAICSSATLRDAVLMAPPPTDRRDPLGAELRRSLREVVVAVDGGNVPSRTALRAVRAAVLQMSVRYQVLGVTLVPGRLRLGSWHVEDKALDVEAVFNMLSAEVFKSVVRVHAKADVRCLRCGGVSTENVDTGFTVQLTSRDPRCPSLQNLLQMHWREYGCSVACQTSGCAPWNPALQQHGTCAAIGVPSVVAVGRVLVVAVAQSEVNKGKVVPRDPQQRVMISEMVHVPLRGAGAPLRYVIRALVERVSGVERWVATVRGLNPTRWYRCADTEVREVPFPAVASPVLVFYERVPRSPPPKPRASDSTSQGVQGRDAAPTNSVVEPSAVEETEDRLDTMLPRRMDTGATESSRAEPSAREARDMFAARAPVTADEQSPPLHGASSPLAEEGRSGYYTEEITQEDGARQRRGVMASEARQGARPCSPPLSCGVQPCGLANVGNTCYLNSLLQCILACAPLRDRFLTVDPSTRAEFAAQPGESAWCALRRARSLDLFRAAQAVVWRMDSGGPVDRDLLDNLRNTSLQLVCDYGYRGVEVDEHEGFRVLMGLLAAEDVFDVLAHSCFQCVVNATVSTRRVCRRCSHVRDIRPEDLAVVELPRPRDGRRSPMDLVAMYLNPRPIEETVCENVACRYWDGVRGAWRPYEANERKYFIEAPDVLVFSVPQASGTHEDAQIVGRSVQLTEMLDLPVLYADNPVLYQLHGVVVPLPGHWIAYARRRLTDTWYLCDDLSAAEAPLPEEIACSMLFYVRLESVEADQDAVVVAAQGATSSTEMHDPSETLFVASRVVGGRREPNEVDVVIDVDADEEVVMDIDVEDDAAIPRGRMRKGRVVIDDVDEDVPVGVAVTDQHVRLEDNMCAQKATCSEQRPLFRAEEEYGQAHVASDHGVYLGAFDDVEGLSDEDDDGKAPASGFTSAGDYPETEFSSGDEQRSCIDSEEGEHTSDDDEQTREMRSARAMFAGMSRGEEDSDEDGEVEEDVHVDDATGEYEEAEEEAGRRDRALESGLIHLLMNSVPGGIMASKQRRNKKWLDLLERVQARVPSTGDEFWEYLPAQAYPWLYRQRTPSGHFVGVMPTRLYVAKRALEDGFVTPERMSYEKMLGLEGPERYDPVMRSYLFALNIARKMETGASIRYVKRGLRGALHHKESMRELSARFGDEILPGMPMSGSDVRTGVAELAALDKCEGPAAYFVTITLAMDRFPGIDDIWNAIVKHPDTNPSPHLPYLSRCWNRARQSLYEWIMLGEERPFGNVRVIARNTDFQIGQGGQNARGNLGHDHTKIWTDDPIMHPDPAVRTAAREAVSARVTADLCDLLREAMGGALESEMASLFDRAAGTRDESGNQIHHHTFSCTDNEGNTRCGLPQRSRTVAEFIEIKITIPEHVADLLEGMHGVAQRDAESGELKLCDWLRGGRYQPRRGAAFPMGVPINIPTYRATGGSHMCGIHCDEGHFANSYLVNYQAGQEERTLVRYTPRDEGRARLEFIDRHLRKRIAAMAKEKKKDRRQTRECIPEPELVALLQQEPIMEVLEVVDWDRGDIRPIEFVHYSTALPSERYVRPRPVNIDAADQADPGPLFGGPSAAEDILATVEPFLPPRCLPSLGQLRVYVRERGSDKCPDRPAVYNMGPPALCALGQLPMKFFNEVAIHHEDDRLPYDQRPLPWQEGVPRGLWAAYRGFYGLRGERWFLRPAFIYHPRYAHLVERVFVNKMRQPDLLATIRDHWQRGTPVPPSEVLDYVEWPVGRAIGVTRHVEPERKLQWLVHTALASDTSFDDEVALFADGAYTAAERALSEDRVACALEGAVIDVLERFFRCELRHWGYPYRRTWKVLVRSNEAFGNLLEARGMPMTAVQRFFFPILEHDLDEEHCKQYREFETAVTARHREAAEEWCCVRNAAVALGAAASEDGLLVRAHREVHGFEMSDQAWDEQLRGYARIGDRLRSLRQTAVEPGSEELSRDGAWVLKQYINPLVIIGAAGTGKSYLAQALHALCDRLRLKWEVTSIMAFMAVMAGGMHAHALGRFHKDDSRCTAARMAEYAMTRLRTCPVLRRYLQELDVLFISEYGNWTDRLITAFDMLLREVRRSSHPFGNLMIIADGDHYQVKPICDHGESSALSCMLTTSLFSSLRLRHLVRCRDPALAEVQSILRQVTPSNEQIKQLKHLLEQHCHVNCIPDDSVGAVRFFAHKDAVREYNEGRAAKVPANAKYTFACTDQEVRHFQSCDLTEKTRKTAERMLDSHTDYVRKLTVWRGMQVMYRGTCRDRDAGVVKCAMGKVTDWSDGVGDHRPWVDVLLERPRRHTRPVRFRAIESEAITGPEGRMITRTQIPLIPAECWTLHMGMGMTFDAVASELVKSDRSRRMWDRGQWYMFMLRVHYLSNVWLMRYEPELIDFLLAKPDPDLAIVDDWVEQTDLLAPHGGRTDPRLLPSGVRELLARPCRTIGSLLAPPDGHMCVYLTQQEHPPYRVYWGYSERVEKRVAEHNSNTNLASKRCRGRTDWLLAAYASTFPNTKKGHEEAKAARHWAKVEMLRLETAGQQQRVARHGWRSLHDNIMILTDLVYKWNKEHEMELRIVATDTNFDVLRRERSGEE